MLSHRFELRGHRIEQALIDQSPSSLIFSLFHQVLFDEIDAFFLTSSFPEVLNH